MKPNSKQSKQESKFRRFLPSGLKSKKEKQKASSAQTVAPDASVFDGSAASSPFPPADDPGELRPSAPLLPVAEIRTAGKSSPSTDQTEPAAPAVESNDPPSEVDQEQILPTTSQRVDLAEKRLEKAGKKLEKIITQKDSAEFEIKASADINTLAENIGAALVSLMEHRKVAESKQSQARSFVVEWAKKTIPFVDTGLTIANV